MKPLLLAPACWLLLAAGPARAQDDTELEALLGESVVTTASRGAEQASAAPATVYTITAQDIDRFGIRSVDDALEFLGIGIYVVRARDYDTGIDVGAQGIIERDGGRRILVMVDGHVINSQDTGQVVIHEGLGVPLDAIDHIEVMVGAGSVMYGSNAMSAVIHVVTRTAGERTRLSAVAELAISPPMDEEGSPTGADDPGEQFGVRHRIGVGATVPFRLRGSPGSFALHAEWLYEESNSYAIPLFPVEGYQGRPGETTWGGPATHTMVAPSAIASLRIGDFRLELHANQYSHGIPFNGLFDDPDARELRRNARADLLHSVLLAPEATLSTRLYADYTQWSEQTLWTSQGYCYEGQPDGCVFERSSYGRSAGLEQILTIDWGLDDRVVTTAGYDVRGRDTTARPSDSRDLLTGAYPFTAPVPYVHHVSALGALFAQQIVRPIPWLTLNAGARLDIDSQFGLRPSPRVAIVWTPREGTSLRASYSEAFRAPTAFELYESDRTYRLAAVDLGPETVRTWEGEWRQRFGVVDISVSGFWARYQDIITSRLSTEEEVAAAEARNELTPFADRTYMLVWDNLDAFNAVGASLAGSVRPADRLTIAGSFTYVRTRRAVADATMPARFATEEVALMPAWFGNARIAYELSRGGATAALAARFAGRRLAYDNVGAVNPVYLSEQLDLRATFTAPLGTTGLRVRASAGYAFNPFQPSLLNAPTEFEPTAPVSFIPTSTPIFGLVEIQYALEP